VIFAANTTLLDLFRRLGMTPKRLTRSDPAGLREWIDKFDTIIFDCDGVLWNHNTLTPDVQETLTFLRSEGKKLVFCTNNATLSSVGYKQKFEQLNIMVHSEELFTSATATAHYLANQVLPSLAEDKRGIFLIGQKGLEDELAAEDLKWKGGSDPAMAEPLPYQDFSSIKRDASIGVVVVGFDMHVNYHKLARAYSLLAVGNGKGPLLVLTNDDTTVPIDDDQVAPGEGAIASCLIHARKGLEKDTTVVGKPNKVFFDAIAEKTGLDRERTIMVGDRMQTDIKFGKNGGVATLMVFSGAGNAADYDTLEDMEKPDFIADDVGVLSVLR